MLLFTTPRARDVPVLKNVNFSARPYERVALVGSCAVLEKAPSHRSFCAFTNPSMVRITVDGKDIASYDLTAFRDRFEHCATGGPLRIGWNDKRIVYSKPGAIELSQSQVARNKRMLTSSLNAFRMDITRPLVNVVCKAAGGQRQAHCHCAGRAQRPGRS
ncbi:MAG: hypothetical protein IPI00_06395 [Flavobacteriales bacterium]|nr:hypothetical protein [Flavobacteriales bacterium]